LVGNIFDTIFVEFFENPKIVDGLKIFLGESNSDARHHCNAQKPDKNGKKEAKHEAKKDAAMKDFKTNDKVGTAVQENQEIFFQTFHQKYAPIF